LPRIAHFLNWIQKEIKAEFNVQINLSLSLLRWFISSVDYSCHKNRNAKANFKIPSTLLFPIGKYVPFLFRMKFNQTDV